MGQITVENPVISGIFETDDRGRITLGSDYKNEELFLVVERTNRE